MEAQELQVWPLSYYHDLLALCHFAFLYPENLSHLLLGKGKKLMRI
jgi:hypothetical protein